MSQGKIKVVMLANAGHKPLDTRIFHKEAISLQKAGHKVTLIIPHSSDFQEREINILSVPLPKKGWEQLIKCPWKILRLALKQPRDSVFHIHDSELLFIGLILKLRGRKVIYDAHEDTPLQISYQHWIPWWMKGPYKLFYYILEKKAGWFFNKVIVAEPVIAKYFPKRKVTLLRNFPIAESFREVKVYSTRNKSLIYVGLLSRPRGAEEMLKSFSLAHEQVKLDFVLGGKFAPAQLEKELLPPYNVQFKGWLSYSEMISELNSAQAGIIVPHPIKRYKTNYPVKLFEYMAAGLPVIASREGESADFVRETDAGILVDPLDSAEIAKAIVKIFRDPQAAVEMGKRGRQLIMDKYNWEKESEKLLELYRTL